MSAIELKGRLICEDDEEVETVIRYLPRHVELTRGEAGCLHFEVVQTEDPLVWSVAERFADQSAFDAHQKRVKASGWGRATAGITRDYVISRGA
ncbi:antibiotic biosynthesis monooxygenase [Brachybacterium muris]|uniref:Antibiotic biosynthesis monooxygenase n=1 Tax=Brachybacterium muris UCD-AY4 TaxID=1249481 RepID=A0A022L5A1_9MICO|nr:antibiotic biosynthesis monooxygenase [Brachybacterium muris]EYT51188.1 antibiotic biosynthesis monooxygenase [Brachybacterium muris UCD-AY4]MBM7501497.1 quinol monooxygenase YgiN [Brachybacterium muris]MCT1429503.1 antibiotic biosynthesis monooxygenase [Brachybacterium muris]MCT1654680.1 antibiotic biosynthesis monooxygenase [Brachybacterium muris]MCT1999436.1 antibiotic biosynthesis monooxygenase [Brachybacterium muris]